MGYKPLLPISNNKVRVKVSAIFVNAAVNPYLSSSIWGTLRYTNCQVFREKSNVEVEGEEQ